MFEEIITQLDGLGVQYTEDYEAGTLTIPVADMDKVQLIEVINILNNSGAPFSIDDINIVVSGTPSEVPMEEGPESDIMDDAMNQALGL